MARQSSCLHIKIDGEWVPYTEGEWVVFDKKDRPVCFSRIEYRDLRPSEGLERHRRIASEDDALRRLTREVGAKPSHFTTIELILHGSERFHALLDQHLGKVPVGQDCLPEAEGEQ